MLRRSLGADPDRLDDIGPALRVALDQGSKLRGRGMGRRDTQRREARREFGRFEYGFEVLAQACSDLRRQPGRSEHAPPMLNDEIDAALLEGRNIRLRCQPLLA